MTQRAPGADYGPAFDKLWAVVVPNRSLGGDRALWSPQHQAWRLRDPYVPGFVDEPAQFAQPDLDFLDSVIRLLEATGEYCPYSTEQRPGCGLRIAGDHFVTPDMTRQAAIYCVQRPDPRVVGSSGGGGDRKHWGSPFGCRAVRPEYCTDQWGTEHVCYGPGLVASEVRDRDWCSWCSRSLLDDPDAIARMEQYERDLLEERAERRRQRAEQEG